MIFWRKQKFSSKKILWSLAKGPLVIYFSAVTEWLESELGDKNSHISHLISRYENSKLLSDLSLLCQNQEADDIAEVFQNILDQCSKTKQKTILNILNSVE